MTGRAPERGLVIEILLPPSNLEEKGPGKITSFDALSLSVVSLVYHGLMVGRGCIRLMVFSATIALGGTAIAGDLPFGRQEKIVGNIKLSANVGVPGLDPVTQNGDPISGTYVSVVCGSGAMINGEYPPPAPYSDAKICRAELRIGGEEIYIQVYPVPPGSGGGGGGTKGFGDPEPDPWLALPQMYWPASARFASNHFEHGSSVEIELKCFYRLYDAEGYLLEGEEEIVTTIVPVAYNRLVSWKTTVNFQGAAWSKQHQDYIDALVTAGRSSFAASKYKVDGAGVSQSKSSILSELDHSTGVFCITHGFPTGLMDSDGWLVSQSSHFMSWSNISSATGAGMPNEDTPPHSLVMLYACDNLSQGDPSHAFRRRPVAGSLLGFAKSLWVTCLEIDSGDDGVGINLHGELLLSNFTQGYHVADALQFTQQFYMTLEPIFDAVGNLDQLVPHPMLLHGDTHTTFRSVYLNSEERPHHEVNGKFTDWYIVIGGN